MSRGLALGLPSLPSLYPRGTSSNPSPAVTTTDVSRHCPTPTGLAARLGRPQSSPTCQIPNLSLHITSSFPKPRPFGRSSFALLSPPAPVPSSSQSGLCSLHCPPESESPLTPPFRGLSTSLISSISKPRRAAPRAPPRTSRAPEPAWPPPGTGHRPLAWTSAGASRSPGRSGQRALAPAASCPPP